MTTPRLLFAALGASLITACGVEEDVEAPAAGSAATPDPVGQGLAAISRKGIEAHLRFLADDARVQ